jgi:hypothetical protein
MLNCFSSTFEVNSAVPAAVAGSRPPLTAIIKPAETMWKRSENDIFQSY